MRNLVAAVFLLAGVALGFVAWRYWQDETDRAADAHRENRYREQVFALSPKDETPDRPASFALGGVGAVLFVSGVIVAVVPQRRETSE